MPSGIRTSHLCLALVFAFTLTASAQTIGTFGATGNMTPLNGQLANLLQNGDVLITGGSNNLENNGPNQGAQLYSPATGSFTNTGSPLLALWGNTATTLSSGMVLLAGGMACPSDPNCQDGVSDYIDTAELYNPATGEFTYTAGHMNVARTGHAATLLPSGEVLITGGSGYGGPFSSAELYNPTTQEFTLTTGSLNTARSGHSATALLNGTVLIAGGGLASAEIYTPSSQSFAYTSGNMNTARENNTVTLLENGTVLFAGGDYGYDPETVVSSAELYNPSTGQFTLTGSMSTPRTQPIAAPLPNGMVLIAGGDNASYSPLASAELYNPPTGTFILTGSMTTARVNASATTLSNGQVLVAGGFNQTDPILTSLGSAELYSETAFGNLNAVTLPGDWETPPCSNADPYGALCAGGTGTPTSISQTNGIASPSIDGKSMEVSFTYPSGTQGSGTVTTSGATVTWVSGTKFSTNWIYLTMTINGTNYIIESVTSTTKLTLKTSAGTHTTAVSYSVFLPSGETVNVLWPYLVGAENSLTHLIGTFSVYIPSLSNIQALEYDQFQFEDGQRFMYGSQCVLGTGGVWWIWNQCANSNDGKWVATKISCSLTAASWHTLQWQTHRVAGDTSCTGGNACMYYDSLTIDGTTYPSGSTTGLTKQCSAPTTFGDNAGIQFQIDESYLGGSVSEYLDLVSLTMY